MKKFNKNSTVAAFAISLVLSLTSTAALAASPAAVNLGLAGNFVILAKTGVSTTGTTSVVGDIGVSPAQATYVTGFSLTLPAVSAFSTSALVAGKIYAPGYADPTPANLTMAVLDMQNAYTDAAGRAPTVTELGAGNIGGMTLVSGTYKWSTGLTIPTNVTLSGGANDVWIFQVAQNLSVSSGVHIILVGGAQAANIFWQVAGQTTIGTTAFFNGNILDQTAIVLNTGATLYGRALAQSAVTLDANTVSVPVISVVATPATPATPIVPTVGPVVTATSAAPATPASAGTSVTPTVSTVSSAISASPAASAGGASVSTTDRAALIAEIVRKINAIRAQINAQSGANSTGSSQATSNANAVANANVNASFNRDIMVGTKGDDVKALQVWLNTHGYMIASSGAGSSGNETMTFGGLTRAALIKFQEKVGITPASGYFGTKTRMYLDAHN